MAPSMGKDKKTMERDLNAEMRHQLGGHQMRRFCASLPAFRKSDGLSSELEALLQKLDVAQSAPQSRYRQ